MNLPARIRHGASCGWPSLAPASSNMPEWPKKIHFRIRQSYDVAWSYSNRLSEKRFNSCAPARLFARLGQ